MIRPCTDVLRAACTFALAATFTLVAACDKSDPAPPPQRQVDSKVVSSAGPDGNGNAARAPGLGACALVTAEEMSTILAEPVTARGEGRADANSDCSYTASGSVVATLTIARGDAEVAMSAVGIARRLEPDLTSPLAGLGDQATQVGPSYWVRRGEDLVTIALFRGGDTTGQAKRVYALVDQRAGKR